MIGKNSKDGGWTKAGEIDNMEMVGGSSQQDKHPDGEQTGHAKMHWNNNSLNGSNSPAKTGDNRKLSIGPSPECQISKTQSLNPKP